MSLIKEIKSFYLNNKDKDQVITTFKEEDIFEVLKEILEFTEHKRVRCVRDLERWTLYFER